MIYADFTILQKGCGDVEFWKCFLKTFCGNIVTTFLKLSWNMLQQQKCTNIFTTFPQRCGSVTATTCTHVYMVSWVTLRP